MPRPIMPLSLTSHLFYTKFIGWSQNGLSIQVYSWMIQISDLAASSPTPGKWRFSVSLSETLYQKGITWHRRWKFTSRSSGYPRYAVRLWYNLDKTEIRVLEDCLPPMTSVDNDHCTMGNQAIPDLPDLQVFKFQHTVQAKFAHLVHPLKSFTFEFFSFLPNSSSLSFYLLSIIFLLLFSPFISSLFSFLLSFHFFSPFISSLFHFFSSLSFSIFVIIVILCFWFTSVLSRELLLIGHKVHLVTPSHCLPWLICQP